MKIEIKKVDDSAAVLFDDDLVALLGVKIGDSITIDFDDEGATLQSPHSDYEVRLERGRGFIRRYIKTFEALAK